MQISSETSIILSHDAIYIFFSVLSNIAGLNQLFCSFNQPNYLDFESQVRSLSPSPTLSSPPLASPSYMQNKTADHFC